MHSVQTESKQDGVLVLCLDSLKCMCTTDWNSKIPFELSAKK